MRALVGLSTMVVGLTIHFATMLVITLMLINNYETQLRYMQCFLTVTNFSEYLIWSIDTPFNVDIMFDIIFHRKIPIT